MQRPLVLLFFLAAAACGSRSGSGDGPSGPIAPPESDRPLPSSADASVRLDLAGDDTSFVYASSDTALWRVDKASLELAKIRDVDGTVAGFTVAGGVLYWSTYGGSDDGIFAQPVEADTRAASKLATPAADHTFSLLLVDHDTLYFRDGPRPDKVFPNGVPPDDDHVRSVAIAGGPTVDVVHSHDFIGSFAIDDSFVYACTERSSSQLVRIARTDSAIATLWEDRFHPCARVVRVGEKLVFESASSISDAQAGDGSWQMTINGDGRILALARDVDPGSTPDLLSRGFTDAWTYRSGVFISRWADWDSTRETRAISRGSTSTFVDLVRTTYDIRANLLSSTMIADEAHVFFTESFMDEGGNVRSHVRAVPR